MKKFIAFFAVLLSGFIPVSAQTLTFMGIPIGSKVSDYKQALIEHNFKNDMHSSYWYGGHFWKFSYCNIHIYNDKSGIVDLVSIEMTPDGEDWEWDDYVVTTKQFIVSLVEKYGSPQIDTITKANKQEKEFDSYWDGSFGYTHEGYYPNENYVFFIYTWRFHNGTLRVAINALHTWKVQVNYTTSERERLKEERLRIQHERLRLRGDEDL